MKYNINLWVSGEGWKLFEVDQNSDELKLRNISIGNGASIGYGASIGNDASIGDDASIGYGASIGYDASIGYGASIGDRASIGDGVKLIKCIYIVGSKHSLTYTGKRTLSIGCHNYPIDRWLESFEIIGKKEGYSNDQIKEYGEYIKAIDQLTKDDK